MTKNLCLALSGGGVRAMAFHAGVLQYFAEQNAFEKISKISTVSGGSLLAGLIYKENNYKWPESNHYLGDTFYKIRNILTTRNLQSAALGKFLNPCNWQYLLSRANVLAQAIATTWDINVKLSDIPTTPEWSINGTTAENGRRFRFKNDTCGDYMLGYAAASKFQLSQALAMSAAFPGGIGPLVINSRDFEWKKRPTWGSPKGSEKAVKLPFKKLHLYDGGVYDNLGNEPFFDSGENKPKDKEDVIFISDAGSPLQTQKHGKSINPFRIIRIVDITMEQCRALRLRSFMDYLNNNEGVGAFIEIGSLATNIVPADEYIETDWQSECETIKAATYGTTLTQMSESDFDLIARHGYEATKAVNLQRGCL